MKRFWTGRPLHCLSDGMVQVTWMKEESPVIYPGECQFHYLSPKCTKSNYEHWQILVIHLAHVPHEADHPQEVVGFMRAARPV